MNEPTIVSQTLTTIEPVTEDAAEETSSAEPVAAPAAVAAHPPAAKADPAPAPPKEDPLDISRRFRGVAQREAKARAQEVKVHEALTQFQEQMAAFEKERAEFAKEREEFANDPAGYAMKRGKDPVDLARKIAKPKTDVEAELDRIKETLAQREAREAEDRKRWEENESKRRQHEARVAFVGSITSDDCPTLVTEFEPQEVPALLESVLYRPAPANAENARAIDRFVSQNGRHPTTLALFQFVHGRNPTDSELKESLEHEALGRATAREERKTRYTRPASPPLEAPDATTGPSGISNQHAAVTNGAKPKSLSLEQRRKKARAEMIAELETEGESSE